MTQFALNGIALVLTVLGGTFWWIAERTSDAQSKSTIALRAARSSLFGAIVGLAAFALQSYLAPVPYQELTSAQLESLTEIFRRLPPIRTFVASVSDDQSSSLLAEQLVQALYDAGKVMDKNVQAGRAVQTYEEGLIIEVPDPKNPDMTASDYIQTIKSFGFHPTLIMLTTPTKAFDVVFFVCPQHRHFFGAF